MHGSNLPQKLEPLLGRAVQEGDESLAAHVGQEWARLGRGPETLVSACAQVLSGTNGHTGEAVRRAMPALGSALAAWHAESRTLRRERLSKAVHDLASPLQTIVSYGHILSTADEVPASMREMAQAVLDEALRLSDRVKALASEETPPACGPAAPTATPQARREPSPRVETRTMTTGARAARPNSSQPGLKKLLIADDDVSLRRLVRATLSSDRYEILEASDGPDILSVAREHQPDLILLDLRLPGFDGFRVCEMLKADPQTASATVVMLTGDAGTASRRKARAAGAGGYLTKPFSPLALIQTVEEVLGTSRTPRRVGAMRCATLPDGGDGALGLDEAVGTPPIPTPGPPLPQGEEVPAPLRPHPPSLPLRKQRGRDGGQTNTRK